VPLLWKQLAKGPGNCGGSACPHQRDALPRYWTRLWRWYYGHDGTHWKIHSRWCVSFAFASVESTQFLFSNWYFNFTASDILLPPFSKLPLIWLFHSHLNCSPIGNHETVVIRRRASPRHHSGRSHVSRGSRNDTLWRTNRC